ncbi:hypothetical protein DDE18_17695 [Nocardioides gansuensis]|uniref:Uncharacterized protein n=1 Tax=Nocardioides gansuensis TaxID=2138300 RepID=A0A2T8F6I8_9ACTN|nr:hypothetical protein [Nocardioides gansuensis]PVG81325.1 hypothetical protein DDE18_17695 [Nocardioides gansuensis]
MTTLDSFARRATRASVLIAGVGLALLTAPAHADVPEGWSNPEDVDSLYALLLLAGVPLLLFVGIATLVYLPAMMRGEKLTPGPAAIEDQWFGGPRQGTQELPAPDDETSQAGGASGRW